LALKQYATVIALADSVRRTSAKDAHAGEKNAALDRFSAQMHVQRARVFFTTTLYDSAAVELRLAEVGFHASESEEEHIIPIYESRALLEYALGITEEQLGRADSAREAFARALQEDLSFVPAHFSMARLSLAAHDTAGAIQDMQLGGKLDPNDPATAFFEGRALLMAGRVPLAVAPFNRSIALDPYFATPHYYLAAIYEGSGYNDEAVEEYQKYLSLAASSDTLLKSAQKRLSALRVAAPITPPPEP
jgi:tetratricopeptide (TPR) repeat protein